MITTEEKLVAAMSGIVGIQQYLVGLPERKTIGQQILESKNYQAFAENKSDMASIEVKAAITSTGSANDPNVPSMTPAIAPGERRPLMVRDLLRSFPTENGAIEQPRRASIANGSPATVGENTTLPEAVFTWETTYEAVKTISVWVPASMQIFEDAGTLDGFLQTDLRYLNDLNIENEILNGDGTGAHLDGLLNNATSYASNSPAPSTEAGILRDAIRQCQAADFRPSAIVLNSQDWYDTEIAQVATSAPHDMTGAMLWGLPVVVTESIAAGTFLCGDFRNAANLYVRQGATIEIARNDDDNFQRNMLSIKSTERLALVNTNAGSGALITGSL